MKHSDKYRNWFDSDKLVSDLMDQAADDIDERDAEIKRLTDTLEIISCKCKSNCGKDEGNCLYWIARSAIQQKDSE